MGERTCSERDCKGRPYARSLCQLHYGRAYRAGVLPPLQMEIPLKPLHSLSNINRETGRGDCVICGPDIRVRLRSGRGAECGAKGYKNPNRSRGRGTPETRREYVVRFKYGLSPEQYAEMMKAQNGRCAVCKEIPEAFVIDHDHACCSHKNRTCGKCVRGLLCRACNLALGYLKDRPDAALAAAAYLRR